MFGFGGGGPAKNDYSRTRIFSSRVKTLGSGVKGARVHVLLGLRVYTYKRSRIHNHANTYIGSDTHTHTYTYSQTHADPHMPTRTRTPSPFNVEKGLTSLLLDIHAYTHAQVHRCTTTDRSIFAYTRAHSHNRA